MIKTESFIYFYLSQGVYFLMKTIKLQQESNNFNIFRTKILIHVVNSQYIFLSETCFFLNIFTLSQQKDRGGWKLKVKQNTSY